MSTPPLLVTADAMTDAPADTLLATAAALLREAGAKACAGTVDTSREDLIGQVIACQQVQNTAWATQSVRLAQVVAIEDVTAPGKPAREVRHGIGTFTDEWLPLELSTRLGWSDRQTTTRIEDATDAMGCTPRLFARTLAGGLDPRKLTVVADTLAGADPDVAGEVEDELLATINTATNTDSDTDSDTDGDDPDGGDGDDDAAGDAGLVSWTSTKLLRRTRRLLADKTPAQAKKSAASRRADAAQVRTFAHQEPGMSVFRAVLPTQDCVRVNAAVEELATQLHQDTTTGKCMDQCRIDAFTDLLLGNASVATTCVIHIPLLPTPTSGQPTSKQPANEGSSAGDGASDGRGSGDLDAELAALVRIATEQGFQAYTATDRTDPTNPAGTAETTNPTETAGTAGAAETAGKSGTADAANAGPGNTRVQPRIRLRWDRTDTGSRQRWRPDEKKPATTPCDRPDPHSTSSSSRTSGLSYAEHTHVADAVFEGLGVIPAHVLVAMCRTFGTKLTRALVDMRTGATVETADQTYKPGARLRRYITTRDQHCRFPGCTRPARADDVDHVIAYPDGPTAAWNLQCLCRHHHRAKHEGGWHVTMTPDGTCTWTSPSGRHYITHPGD